MSAPRLNRRLTLDGAVRVTDGAGGFSESWAVLGDLWAEVTARTGRERGEAGMPLSSVVYRIVVRGAPAGSPMRPQAGQRFREGSRVFMIRAVAEKDPAGRYLTCFADEEVAT